MTNSIAELEHADVILLTGSNTTENHPVIANVMKRGILQNGTKLIVVDPRAIDMTRFATHWLRQRSGSDVAWINGMMHVILEEGLYDKAVRGRADRGVRGPEGGREEVHARIRGGDLGDSGAGPRGRRQALRVREEGLHLLRHGHHPAHHRHGQREEPGQPGHALRQRGNRERGRQPAARTEQRAGGLRHGRPAQCVHGLPEGGRPGCTEEVRRGLGRLPSGQAGPDDRGDHERGPRGNDQGPLHHGREPDGERSGPDPRGGIPQEPRVPGRAGHLPDRDGQAGGRGASRR